MCGFPVVPALLFLGGVLGRRCARSVCGVACTVSWASWLLFIGVPAPCVVLRVRRPGPPGSCSPLCTLCVWCCVLGFLGLLAPVLWRASSHCVVAWAVSWAAWLLFTGVPASVRCVVCTVSWAPWLQFTGVHALCASCMCRVLGLLAPVHRCACSLCAPRLLPISLPHPRLFLCMLLVTALLLFPATAFSSSWRPWLLHSSLRLC